MPHAASLRGRVAMPTRLTSTPGRQRNVRYMPIVEMNLPVGQTKMRQQGQPTKSTKPNAQSKVGREQGTVSHAVVEAPKGFPLWNLNPLKQNPWLTSAASPPPNSSARSTTPAADHRPPRRR